LRRFVPSYPLAIQANPSGTNLERDAFLKKYDLKDDNPLPVDVTIQEGSACFIVLDEKGVNATRYCTVDGSPLSVNASFPTQYAGISAQMAEAEKGLKEANFLPKDSAVLVLKTISEIEDPKHIESCKPTGECPADMLGTLVQPPSAASGGGQPTAQIIAALRVLQPMQFADTAPILKGDYVVRAWYDADKVFIGATISGLPNAGVDQQIPAIPPTFVSKEGAADELLSEISGYHIRPKGPAYSRGIALELPC